MKTIIAAAAFIAALNGAAFADGKVDRSIDQAAARIVAGRIGDIRGGFAPGVAPTFVRTVSAETTASTKRVEPVPARRGPWIDGLARARDPLAGRSIVGL
ncbi:MAG: hypothetical protein ACK4U0_12820 [Mesorhizobium sp.]